MYELTRYRMFHIRQLIPILLLAAVSKRRVFSAVPYFLASGQPLPGCKVPVLPSSLCIKNIFTIQFISRRSHAITSYTYFRASAFTFPIACTAASLTSTASHLSKGTVSLYKAAGLAFVPGDLLSPRSADRLSGEELRKRNCCVSTTFHRYVTEAHKLIIVCSRIFGRSLISGKRSDRERS